MSTASSANSEAVIALAAICVAVTVSSTNFAPVIVAFAIWVAVIEALFIFAPGMSPSERFNFA